MNFENKLWCDCKTDEEKLEFIKSGRAWETGIVAHVLVPELIDVYERLLKINMKEGEL